MELKQYDLIIVGGGPVGMFAAYYAGLHQLNALLVESLSELGGQVKALYPEKDILDVAGYPSIKGKDLINNLQRQIDNFPIEIMTDMTVTNIKEDSDGYILQTKNKDFYCKKVLLATGNGSFSPRKLAVDNIEQFENKNLWYFLPSLDKLKDKVVLVAGGGDSAIENAVLASEYANKVYLVHRRDAFRALPFNVTRLEDSSVEIETPYIITDLSNKDSKLKVTLKVIGEEETKDILVDDVLINYGFTSNKGTIDQWNVQLEQDHRAIKVASNMESNVNGIYVVGDASTHSGNANLIASGFGEAITAITEIAKSTHPEKNMAMHSTSIHLSD